MALPGIVVKVTADTAAAVKDIGKFNTAMGDQVTSAEKFEAGLKRMTPAATAAFGAVAAGTVVAANAAIQLEDQMSAMEGVFGDAYDQMAAYSQGSSELGLSQAQYAEGAALLSNSLIGLGTGAAEAATMTDELITASAAMSAQFGKDSAETTAALTAAFRGEYDALQALVPGINAAAVEQRALADTGKTTADALTEAEEAAAVYALIMDGAAPSLANFSEQSESAAFKLQEARAAATDATAAFGEALLPAISAATDVAIGFTEWAAENPGVVQGVATAIAVASGAILAMAAAIKIVTAVQKTWRAVLAAFRVAQVIYITMGYLMGTATLAATWPILAIIAAIAALIVIIVLLVKNWDKVLAVMKNVINWIKSTAIAVWDSMSNAISRVVGWLKSAWDWIKKILNSGISKIPGIGGSSSAGMRVASPSTAAVRARTTNQAPIVVNVNAAAADAEGTARAVQRVLDRSATRNGRQLAQAGAW